MKSTLMLLVLMGLLLSSQHSYAAGGPYTGGGPFAGNGGSTSGGGGGSNPNVSNATGLLPVANGGDGQVSGLTFNSSAAASANVTAIQTAFNSGGRVTIDCPAGSLLYINAPLQLHSFTSFYAYPSCTFTGLNGASPMLTNEASQSAWTTLYDSSGVVTNGPLSLINTANIGTWAGSTAYSKGVYEQNAGNVYWCATAGTSASSGGPTGTGSGITDGTAVWNYVTVDPGSAVVGVIVHYPSHGLSVGNPVFISPEGDSGSNPYWSGRQTAHTRGGPVDSAYMGVFPVIYVNDSNYVTIILRRAAAAAFSGIPMNIKAADQNITVAGNAVWNGNYPTNNSCTSNTLCHNIMWAGVMNLVVDGITPENQNRYEMIISGVENADIGHFTIGPLGSPFDGIKVYGPTFDLRIHDVFGASQQVGVNQDDFLTFNTEESLANNTTVIAVGDILNVTVTNVTGYGGHSIGAYQSNQYLYMDNFDISHIQGNNMAAYTPWYITVDPGGGTDNGGLVGTMKIHDLTAPSADLGNQIVEVNATSTTINSLTVENVNTSLAAANTGSYLVGISAGTIQELNEIGNTGQVADHFNYIGGGTIGQFNMIGNNINCNGIFYGAALLDAEGGTIGQFNFDENTIAGTCNGQNLIIDKIGIPLSMTNNYMPSYNTAFLNLQASDKIYVANNVTPSMTSGLLTFNAASLTSTVKSGGGNSLGTTWFNYGGSGTGSTYTVQGFDIPCDVTKANRVTGSYCSNTNTAPGSGTLTTAGPVMDQGTSSNSWFLLSNPSGQQY